MGKFPVSAHRVAATTAYLGNSLFGQHGAAFQPAADGLRNIGTFDADILQQPIIQGQKLALGLARASPGPHFAENAAPDQAQKDASRRRRLENNSRSFHAFTPSGNAKPTARASHRYVFAQPLVLL